VKAIEILLFTLGGIYHGISQDWNILEIAILAALALAIRRGRLPSLAFAQPLEGALARFARRRAWTCVAAGAAAVLARVLLLPLLPVPKPLVADEFSHLLLADTLLHGRVANPAHPLWRHFETLHVIQRPVYVSNYFPGIGAVLAAARWAAGSPWWGVLALSGIFTAVLCWALQGWMPARWALLGSVLAILRFSIGSYWINGFHGGFLAATGGALIAGAYPRLRRSGTGCWLGNSLILGLGLAILAWTRPYEGLLFASPFVIALLPRPRALAPAVVLASASLIPLGFYFYRISGSPVVTVYQLNLKTYGWPTTFAWVSPPVIHHTNPELKSYYDYENEEHRKLRTPLNFLQYLTFKIQEHWRFFVGPMFTACLLWCGWIFRRRRFLVLLCAAGGAFLAVMLAEAASPHYLSPATMPIIAILALSIWRMRERFAAGAAISRWAVLAMALVLCGRIAAGALGLPYTQKVNYQSWCCKVPDRQEKTRFTEYLNTIPGRHLVLVKFKTDPYNFFQWVYNGADIDSQRVVWARDLGDNRALLEHFRGRALWRLDPNVQPPTLNRVQ
jgi:hypothetical protein